MVWRRNCVCSTPLARVLDHCAEGKRPFIQLLPLMTPHKAFPFVVGLRELPGQRPLVVPLPLQTKAQ